MTIFFFKQKSIKISRSITRQASVSSLAVKGVEELKDSGIEKRLRGGGQGPCKVKGETKCERSKC